MISSMTGYAGRDGHFDTVRWRWEMRSVNARGLDLRIRAPEGADRLEPALRAIAQKKLSRGAVSIGLRMFRDETAVSLRLNGAALSGALAAAATVAGRAQEAGVTLAPVSVGDLLGLRGVLDAGAEEPDEAARAALDKAMLADAETCLNDLIAARAAEGARLAETLDGQVARIAELVAEAAAAAARQTEAEGPRLRQRVAALLEAGAPADADRLVQELALIAVKSDVREELDRLTAHVASARDLLSAKGPVGRKLDFLMQEFNREANTLCSKAASTEMTNTGLALKVVIDQMREQVQNIE